MILAALFSFVFSHIGVHTETNLPILLETFAFLCRKFTSFPLDDFYGFDLR